MNDGDIKDGLRQSSLVVEGQFTIGPVEHFYMETNATLARPNMADGQLEIFCSAQWPALIQVQMERSYF